MTSRVTGTRGWLDVISQGLPTRAARDLIMWAVHGDAPSLWFALVLAEWTALTAALAVHAYRRDEGQRYS